MLFTRTLPTNWRRTDALVAVALAFVGALMGYATVVAGVTYNDADDARLLVLSAVLLAAPMAWYRRFPIIVAPLVSLLYMVLGYTIGLEVNSAQVVLYLSFYAVGAWEDHRRRSYWVRVGIIAAMAIWLLVETVRGFTAPETGEMGVSAYFAFLFMQWTINLVFFGAGWFFGERAWKSAKEREELDAAYAQISEQQQVIAQHATESERMRIARELHDTVAHHVTVMGVQAAAARRVLDRDIDRAQEQLRGVETSSRQAVQELQAMVHTLRDSEVEQDSLPGVDGLEDLVKQARHAGQRVRYNIVDAENSPSPDLSPSVELTVYRVVQESLSNARKHAGPTANVSVTLRYLTGGIEVDVSDDGWGEGAPKSKNNGTGMGLQGMEERVTAVGGTFESGPKTRGGWLVRAEVPTSSSLRVNQ